MDNPRHDVIADPMCGSGTVGVEGVVNNREVLCVDLDPLSCLMARGKTQPVQPTYLRNVAKRILSKVEDFPSKGEVSEEVAEREVRKNLEDTPSAPPLNLFHWFDPYVAVGYSRLLKSAYNVLDTESERMKNSVRTSLASIVRKVSRADPQPVSGLEVTSIRKQHLNGGLTFDVRSSFERAVGRLADGYEQLLSVDKLGPITVVEDDARRFSDIVSERDVQPSLVITSPPYCNAIEYTRRHRLEYEWLGLFEGKSLDEIRDNRLERSRDFIGSSTSLKASLEDLSPAPHKKVQEITRSIEYNEGKSRKANLLRKYFLDAYDWVKEIYKALPTDGLFVATIGPSTSYGHKIDTPQFLTDIAVEVGFELENKSQYKLTNNKMQYPTKGETTDTETLIELRVR